MIASSDSAQFRHRTPHRVWLLRLSILCGFASLLYYFSWWFGGGRIFSWWLLIGLGLAALYHWCQTIGNWLLYLYASPCAPLPRAPDGLSVDVYLTAYNEPYELIQETLTAACNMRGDYRVWLLDDGDDPALAELAAELGAGYLVREDRKHAKAGNLNAALPRTSGDIIVIFDGDHAPEADFLERSLGYFADPDVGFVQVMLTFRNSDEGWVPRAAAESSLDYYNPTSIGADSIGSATLVGSNALIRRTALESIGGYRPGLAEDLATSIALHAAGWQSAYVAEPLAPGLAPPDLRGWFTQQLKWSRGVFEVLITDAPRLWSKLTYGQRLSYSVRMSYYWIGLMVFVHLAFVIAMMLGNERVAIIDFNGYLTHIAPLAICAVVIRQLALYSWRHESTPLLPLWRAMVLVYATWPAYVLSWLAALVRLPPRFRPTPKRRGGRIHAAWLAPQIAVIALLASSLGYASLQVHSPRPLLVLVFAVFQIGVHTPILYHWWNEGRLARAVAK